VRAAIYCRYSTDKQRSASISDQTRVCRTELERRGWEEAEVFADAEVSGAVARGRPRYQALLRAAQERKFDVIIAEDLQRVFRDQAEQAYALKRLAYWGVGLVTVADGIDTIAAPEAAGAIALLKGYMGEKELAAIAHRTRRGLEGRVRSGHSPGGGPYGYRSRPIHADRPGDPPESGPIIGYEPYVWEPEAQVVRRVFALYRDGKSARTIAGLLNAEGTDPPGARWANRRTRAARTWSATAISGSRRRGLGILNNERYIGRLVWNRTQWVRDPDRETRVRRERGEQEWVITQREDLRIVPQGLWDEVKRLQEERSVANDYSASHRRERRLLSGLLICGECGSRFVLHGANCYACASRLNRGDAVCTSRVTVSAVWAQQAMLDILQTTLFDEETVQEMLRRARSRLKGERRGQDHEEMLHQQLAQADAEARRLVRAIQAGALVGELTASMREVEARRKRLQEELDAAADGGSEALDVVPELVQQATTDLRVMLEGGQTQAVRRAVSRMITRIDVKGAKVPGRKLLEPRLYLHGNLPGLLTFAAEKSTKVVAGAGFVEVEKTRHRRWMRRIAFWAPGKVVETVSRRRRLRRIAPDQAPKPPKVAGW
jgi:site-specific DNA recombinase